MMGRFQELEKYRGQIYLCNECRCGFCSGGCPIFDQLKGESMRCRGKMAIAQAVLDGVIKPTKRLIDVVFLCMLCGWCKERCPNNSFVGKINVDTTSIIEAFRADLARFLRIGPLVKCKQVCESIQREGNPFMKPKTERIKWLQRNIDLPKTEGKKIKTK